MQDYQGNPKSKKEAPKDAPAKKDLKKVTTGEVVVAKKSIGSKIKDLFIEADIKTVARYVASDVLLPAARNMFVDATTKGIERMIYGPDAIRRRNQGGNPLGTYFSYNNPINRGDPRLQVGSGRPSGARVQRAQKNDFIISSREEAELVLDKMREVIEHFDVVSVHDLHELLGVEASHVDHGWGWENLRDARILAIPEGFVIDFPPAQPIKQ